MLSFSFDTPWKRNDYRRIRQGSSFFSFQFWISFFFCESFQEVPSLCTRTITLCSRTLSHWISSSGSEVKLILVAYWAVLHLTHLTKDGVCIQLFVFFFDEGVQPLIKYFIVRAVIAPHWSNLTTPGIKHIYRTW